MGFNPRLAPYSVKEVFAHDPAADEQFLMLRFPAAGRVISGYAVNTEAIATATNTLALYAAKASTALAMTVQGTLGSWAAGSTWAADTVRNMTMAAFGSTALFSEGEKLYLKYDEASTGTWTEMTVQFDYVLGTTDAGEPPAAGTGPA